jgi:hypothetical protein
VRVTALCPGPVPTEFQARAGDKTMRYPRMLVRTAERVAAEGYLGLQEGRRVVIPGFPNRLIAALAPLMPRAWLLQRLGARNRDRV